MAQLISVRLNRPDGCPLGFRLQGGKDFGTPLVIQKVNGGSPADKAGLVAGDSVIKVNTTDVYNLRHKEAQDVIVQAGQNFDVTVQRGGSTWKPSVQAVGSLPSPARSLNSISPVTQTSLKANQQSSNNIGSGYNSAAKPFNYMNGNGDSSVKSIVNKQYNTPVGIYSEETIAETLSAQAEVLAGGVLGVNFKKNEKTYDAEKSEVFKMLQEADNDPEPEVCPTASPASSQVSGLRHVTAPITRPDAPVGTGGLPPGQNICEECERLIIGVFVRIKDKNLHVECFKCATCGSSLKNQGYYNLNGKLYCDIHAKMVARQNPPAPNLEPVTVLGNKPTGHLPSTLTSPLSTILPPLTGNGPSSLLSNKNDLNGNLTDISLKLNQDNVDAFANILSNNELEKETVSVASFNNNTEKKLSNNATEAPTNGISNNLLSVYPISVQTQGFGSPLSTSSSNVFKKVIPPHMGGNYKPSNNISGPKPFGAPMSPAAHSPISSMSPRSGVTAPLSPASPASTLSRPSHQYTPGPPTQQYSALAPPLQQYSAPAPPLQQYSAPPAPQQITVKSVKNIVWPPKNAPEDEESQDEPDETSLPSQVARYSPKPSHPEVPYSPKPQTYRTEPAPQMPAPWLAKASRSDPDSHHVTFQDQVCQEQGQSHTSQREVCDQVCQRQDTQNQVCQRQDPQNQVCQRQDSQGQTQLASNLVQTSYQSSQSLATSSMQVSSTSSHSMSTMQSSTQYNECSSQQSQRMSSVDARNETRIYQSQTSVPIQKTYNTPTDSHVSQMTDESYALQNMSQHKQSICSAEVTNITGKKSPMECVETISEKIDTQQLVQAITNKCETPRPPSPTPDDKPSPIEEKPEDVCLLKSNAEEREIEQQVSVQKEIQRRESLSAATDDRQNVPRRESVPISNSEKQMQKRESVTTVASNDQQVSVQKEIQRRESLSAAVNGHKVVLIPPVNIGSSVPRQQQPSPLLDALTIAPDRPYSPLPEATQAGTLCPYVCEPLTTCSVLSEPVCVMKNVCQTFEKEVQNYQQTNEIKQEKVTTQYQPYEIKQEITPTQYQPYEIKQEKVTTQYQPNEIKQEITPTQYQPYEIEQEKVQTQFQPNEIKEEIPTTQSEEIDSYVSKPFASIPPIRPHTPAQASSEPVPMPKQTAPYIPPDIPFTIEKRPPRDGAVSPLVSALTVAPCRPYTPLGSQPIERGSLLEALTIAPERPYTPLNEQVNTLEQTVQTSAQMVCSKPIAVNALSKECVRPVATQACQTVNVQTSQAPVQTVCQFQSSTQMSAFKPVAKNVQTFPPPYPEEYMSMSANSNNQHVQTSSSVKQESRQVSETSVMQSYQSSQAQHSRKQEYFESQSAKNIKYENLTTTAKRASSGLHSPSNLPCYQKNLEQLPSQRGKTPEITNEKAVLQTPVTQHVAPDSIDPHLKQKIQSNVQSQEDERREQIASVNKERTDCKSNQSNQSLQQTEIIPPVRELQKEMPISMTFQPVTEANLRVSPIVRSRPTTPSLINKPAPLIPYYQMNLVTVECPAPETNLYELSSPEVSRSPTPKMIRTRSPAPGPPPNPLKIQAPKIKEAPSTHALLTQATANLRKDNDTKKHNFQSNIEVFNTSGANNWAQSQQSFVKAQQMTKIGFHSTQESFDTRVSESSVMSQQHAQKATQSQTVSQKGGNSVQRTKKVFEEYERTQSAKTIEIQKNSGAVTSYSSTQAPIQSSVPSQNYIQQESQRNVQQLQSTIPIVSFRPESQPEVISYVPPSANTAAKPQAICGQPCSITSGANNNSSGPVCDPTPSTGGAGAGAARGKTFGVSSAPKRGRGILNKAAGPGTRVALCAHCNGHIRGPFITALGRIWCPEHFVCVNNTCKRHLQDIGFVEENGQLYCEYCFEQFIAPACDKCHGKIKGDCLNAIGKHFHPECFNCAYCGKLFGNNPFFLEEGLPYCEADWNELFTTKCIACGFPVEAGDRWVEALNNNYHSQCFNCTMCKKNLEGQSFYAKGGRPFCKSHAR